MSHQFKAGDRAKYTTDFTPELTGKTGTVVTAANQHSIEMAWDDGYANVRYVMAKNLSPIHAPAADEVSRALATLRAAGEVTFTPRKLPFQTILVDGVGSYNAVVHLDHVSVGCQYITFDKVDEIAAAVAKAREYAKS